MNVLSLFAGIGGLDLGLERAGFNVVGQVEINPFCRRVLARHWPEVPRHDDVRTAPAWWRSGPRPAVHVVAGGFPCQPFSTAGLRRGTDDPRWGWPWMFDVVRALRPRFVIVENVAALLRDADAFGWLLADLADFGFDAEWSVLPACALGAPHPRERVFLVAYPAKHDGEDQGAGSKTTRRLRDEPGGGRRRTHARSPGWLPEPAVGRVADGVPYRVVKPELFALGNAVVPQVAEHIGRLALAGAR